MWHVPCVPRSLLFASETEKKPPKELRGKTPFSNDPSVQKRSVTKGVCTGYLAHVPKYVPFTCRTQKGYP